MKKGQVSQVKFSVHTEELKSDIGAWGGSGACTSWQFPGGQASGPPLLSALGLFNFCRLSYPASLLLYL